MSGDFRNWYFADITSNLALWAFEILGIVMPTILVPLTGENATATTCLERETKTAYACEQINKIKRLITISDYFSG